MCIGCIAKAKLAVAEGFMSWAPTEGDSEMQNWKVQLSVKRVVLHDSGIGVKNEIIGHWQLCNRTLSNIVLPKKKKIQR